MSLVWPIALWLLVPLGIWWYRRPFRNPRVQWLRLGVYVLAVLALAGLRWEGSGTRGVWMVVADRSLSMPDDALALQQAQIRQLQQAMPPGYRMGVVSFARNAVVEFQPGSPGAAELAVNHSDRNASNLAEALALAIQQIPNGAPGRILLLTDGRWSGGEPDRAFRQAAARGIPVDFRRLERRPAHDVAILDVDAPDSVAAGEYFTVSVRLRSPDYQAVRYRVRRNGREIAQGSLDPFSGTRRLTFRDRGDAVGIHDYEIIVSGAAEKLDEVPENNRVRRLVEITGRKPVLLLSNSASGGLGNVLEAAGIPVLRRTPSPTELEPAVLAGVAAVVLEDVPADTLGFGGMELLAGMVRSGALGLVMTGGPQAFLAGGYYRSPLEDLLPVELKPPHDSRREKLAMVVALDRSGSMTMLVGSMSKMDLAAHATLEVFRLLDDKDLFGVNVVDTTSHTVLPLEEIGKQKQGEAHIRSIRSQGGGIFIYQALEAGIRELQDAAANKRHMILFADADDSQEPGEYADLLTYAANSGITVSVIGMGKPTDSDAALLKDVARYGGGRCYFSDRAEELPRLFTQDAFMVAQPSFVETPIEAQYRPGARLLRSEGFGDSTSFGGYNVCYPKKGAEIVLAAVDEASSPLVAIQRVGLGRVGILAAEADGPFSGAFAKDPERGPLLAALVGWCAAQPEQGGSEWLVESMLDAGSQRIRMHLNPSRAMDPFRTMPLVRTVTQWPGRPPVTVDRHLAWVTSDQLELVIPLEGGSVSLSTVSVGDLAPVALPPVTPGYSPEYIPEVEARRPLAELCAATGGAERFAAEELWKLLPERRQYYELAPWLAVAAMVLFLAEILERRTAIFTPRRRSDDGVATTVAPVAPTPVPVRSAGRAAGDKIIRKPPAKRAAAPKEKELGDALRRVRKR